ncbi:MAG: hypothetical protein HY077_13810 [Elusimicrobia bacterium]|nr:hypothetical protein [Elusimicrobiota bacterium]
MASLLCALVLAASAASAPTPAVLLRAYSHNDYKHERPLFDALDRGFFGVEADVHLRGQELLVGHKGGDVRPGATLQKLYLDPLLRRVRENGGRVYRGGPKGFLLMIEFKSNGEESYSALRQILGGYREMLTVYYGDRIKEAAVTISITGHRPNAMLRDEPMRLAGIDGDFHDVREPEKTLYPTISDDFSSYFQWHGELSPQGRQRLRRFVDEAHARGRKLRLYGIPANEELWGELYAAGVDLINTDDLDKLRDWLLKKVSWRRLAPDSLARFWNRLKDLPADPFR